GKVVFVAAASKGLGRAIAQGFASEGAKVVICSRSEANVAAAAKEIAKATGAEVLPVTADVSSRDGCERFVREGLAKFGRMDVMVVNAGGPPPGRFEELDEAKWDTAYQVTLKSAVRLTDLAIPELRKTKGNLLYSTSTTVRMPTAYVTLILSNALRAAVHGMLKTLSKDLATDGIRVNALQPGRIQTERIEELDSDSAKRTGRPIEDVRKDWHAMIPLGRYGDPREYADAAVFLASERASFITGVSLQVDGGMLPATW
ncbi:MAG: SDR family oxidoreductase, partial [Chloroflexota bacterium]|nr:SDR family oxidoreductase [Chloroflexota bacterium]